MKFFEYVLWPTEVVCIDIPLNFPSLRHSIQKYDAHTLYIQVVTSLICFHFFNMYNIVHLNFSAKLSGISLLSWTLEGQELYVMYYLVTY